MTMTLTARGTVEPALEEQETRGQLLLEDIPWDLYEGLVEALNEQHISLTYDNGRLELMSPLPAHEKSKVWLGTMIRLMAIELNIPLASLGSTTYKREDLLKGLEPDTCFYIQHEKQIRGKDRIDLSFDPPPDLVIEIDITHRNIRREGIYAAMGVAEVWRYNGRKLACLHLDAAAEYKPHDYSLAFPFLKISDLEPFMKRLAKEEETSVMRSWRDWVQKLPGGA